MKKVWYIFKEYYLFYTVISFGLFIVIYFTSEETNNKVFYAFLFPFLIWLITLVLGTIELLSHTYYRPWKIKKMLNSTPFIEFKRKGFVNDDENDLKGNIRGYNLFIGILWENHQKQPLYFVQIIFNPFSNKRFLRKDEYEKFEDSLSKENKTLTLNSLIIIKDRYKGFKKTKYEVILKDIFEAIDFLRVRKLESISFRDWLDNVPNIEKHAKTFVYD